MLTRLTFALVFASVASAQSVYIDVGAVGSTLPSPNFSGAAASSGQWNRYVPRTGPTSLFDLQGMPTSMALADVQVGPQSDGNGWTTGVPGGDPGALLGDGLGHSQGGNQPWYADWYFSGIPAGEYRLHMFGWRRYYDTEFQVFDGAVALTDVLFCQWATWSGQLVEGETHVTTFIDLSAASTTLRIRTACWSSFSDWGAVNGFQFERMPDCGDAPLVYCSSGTSTHGCVATISAVGTASASATNGFPITVSGVEGQRSGLIFYGVNGPELWPWNASSTSVVCVAPARQRTPIHVSGGSDGACDGALALDWNAYRASHPTAVGQPFAGGEVIYVQAWYRDGAAPGKANLSNALAVPVCP